MGDAACAGQGGYERIVWQSPLPQDMVEVIRALADRYGVAPVRYAVYPWNATVIQG